MKQRLIGIHLDPTYRYTVRENKKVYRKIYEELVKRSKYLDSGHFSVNGIIDKLRRNEPWRTRIDNGQSLLAWEKHFYRSYWGQKWLALKAISVPPSK